MVQYKLTSKFTRTFADACCLYSYSNRWNEAVTIVHVEVAQRGAAYCVHFRSSDSRLLPLEPANAFLGRTLYSLAPGPMFHTNFEVRRFLLRIDDQYADVVHTFNCTYCLDQRYYEQMHRIVHNRAYLPSSMYRTHLIIRIPTPNTHS